MTHSLFHTLLAGSVGLDVLVAARVLFRRTAATERDQPHIIDSPRLLVALLWVGGLFVPRAFVVELVLHAFAAINITYVTLVVSLPLIGLTTLIGGRRHSGVELSRAVRVASVVLLLPAAVGVYATFVEPFRLQLERADVSIPRQRLGSAPIRIGVLADIQTARVTDYETRAVEQLMALKPDIILLPGDLFQGNDSTFAREESALRELIARLSAPGGVYCVLGNVDRRDRIERIIEDTHVRLLVNEIVRVEIRDRRLTIGGLELRCISRGARNVISEMEQTGEAGDVRVLMSHLPDVVHLLQPDTRIDLTVAGHTHGGQVVIPFFGPPITLSNVPRSVAAGGHHVMNGRQIYVSRGLGCERGLAPRIRFLCTPEITLLTLGD